MAILNPIFELKLIIRHAESNLCDRRRELAVVETEHNNQVVPADTLKNDLWAIEVKRRIHAVRAIPHIQGMLLEPLDLGRVRAPHKEARLWSPAVETLLVDPD